MLTPHVLTAGSRDRLTAGSCDRRTIAVLAVILLLALSGCSPTKEPDTRPRSDRVTLIEDLRALPGVLDVEDSGQDEPLVAVLDADPDDADLRTAGNRLHRLVSGFRYPEGTPAVVVRSGDFTAQPSALTGRRDATASYDPDENNVRLDLTGLLDLKALPDVASGTVTESRAHVVLRDGTDPRSWIDEAMETSVRIGLDVLQSDEPEATPVYSLDMGSAATAEAVTSLHTVLDSVGAHVVEFRAVSSIQHPNGHFALDGPNDLITLQEELRTTFGSDAMRGFSATTADGVTMNLTVQGAPIEDRTEAIAMLQAAGITVNRVTGGGTAIDATADGAEALRSAADALAADSWPLESDTVVHIHHQDAPYYSSTFEASEWADHVDVPAVLWEAGFTSVRCTVGRGATDQAGTDGAQGTGGADGGTDTADSPGAGSATSEDDVVASAIDPGFDPTADLIIEIGTGTGPDFTAATGRDALVQALRDAGWDGTANIVLGTGDRPSFTSTAHGPAENVRDASGLPDAPRTEWGREFIAAWDATTS